MGIDLFFIAEIKLRIIKIIQKMGLIKISIVKVLRLTIDIGIDVLQFQFHLAAFRFDVVFQILFFFRGKEDIFGKTDLCFIDLFDGALRVVVKDSDGIDDVIKEFDSKWLIIIDGIDIDDIASGGKSHRRLNVAGLFIAQSDQPFDQFFLIQNIIFSDGDQFFP